MNSVDSKKVDLSLDNEKFFHIYGHNKTVGLFTLGCRVNQYETEAMAEKFISEGYSVVNFEDHADVYVINTCTVTNMGDKKSRQMIHRARRKNKRAIIAVVGCYSQISPGKVSKIEGVDVVLGTRNKEDIIYFIKKACLEQNKIIEVGDVLKNRVFEDLSIDKYQHRTRAFVKIQDGCNRFCSYCLIPFARGAVCSKPPSKILEEVEKLAHNNFREITLSGIHIASYGTDLKSGWDLMKILEEVDGVSGIERVRIGSIDPKFFTDDVIDRIKKLKKLCPHFHLSLQSGCDETLRRMNRHYTALEYERIVNELRNKIEDVSITTDVIVGFPGETEDEFNKTYDFLKKMKLSKIHVFKYSPRKGTRAADMKGQIDGKVKEERSGEIIKLDRKLEKKFMGSFLGRNMDVFYESKFHGDNNCYEGYTPNYMKVVSMGKSGENPVGKILRTELESVESGYIRGKIKSFI